MSIPSAATLREPAPSLTQSTATASACAFPTRKYLRVTREPGGAGSGSGLLWGAVQGLCLQSLPSETRAAGPGPCAEEPGSEQSPCPQLLPAPLPPERSLSHAHRVMLPLCVKTLHAAHRPPKAALLLAGVLALPAQSCWCVLGVLLSGASPASDFPRSLHRADPSVSSQAPAALSPGKPLLDLTRGRAPSFMASMAPCSLPVDLSSFRAVPS